MIFYLRMLANTLRLSAFNGRMSQFATLVRIKRMASDAAFFEPMCWILSTQARRMKQAIVRSI